MRFYNLRLFEDGNGSQEGGNSGEGGNGGQQSGANTGGSYSYQQAEEIATARAERAERAALSSYFKQQGMTQEEVEQALKDFKSKRESARSQSGEAQKTAERERDEARQELEQYKQKDKIKKANVEDRYVDFVMFEVSKKVDDKTTFDKALEKYLKENPQYTSRPYRVSQQAAGQSSGGNGDGSNASEFINSMIRRGARR